MSTATKTDRPRNKARLAADFAPATYDDWRKLVDGVLKGAPFEKLVSKTYDGLKIEPIYPRARGCRADRRPRRRGALADHAADRSSGCRAGANAQALHDLENGATGLTLVFAGANGARGFGLDRHAGGASRRCSTACFSTPASRSSCRSARSRGWPRIHLADSSSSAASIPATCDIRFGFDPIGACAVWGSSAYHWAEIAPAFTDAIKELAAPGFKGPFAVADGRVIHDAGGSEVQELAFVLAAGVAYLRALEAGRHRARRRPRA